MAQQLAQVSQQGGAFTTNTQLNPKEHCKAVATKSGKVIGKGVGDDIEVERKVVEEFEKEEDDVEGSDKEVEEENKEEELVENEKMMKKRK